LRHSSLRYKTEECLDLPEKIYTVAPYQLTKEQKDYYRAEIDKIKAAVDNPFELGGSYHRLKTICSGWIGAKDDDGERVDIIFDENPKLDAIMDWLDSLDPNEKVLLFNHYIGTGDIYEAALKERKIGFARLYSKTRDREGVQDRFINDKKCRVFLSSSSGAKGLNLQCARYCTFIESPSTPDQRDQMEKRVHRMGQDRTVFITDFVARRSLEEKNLKSLAEGVDLFTAIIEGKVDLDLDI
jgi:SNF2 family DNA or RNA helicase